MNYWIVKTEPSDYSWEEFLKDKEVIWDGVRNYQARNNLKAMKKGDLVLFYRSVKNPALVGIAKVEEEYFPDPTDETGKWVAVRLVPVKSLSRELPLKEIKKIPALQELRLIKQPRLSVMPISEEEFFTILNITNTKL